MVSAGSEGAIHFLALTLYTDACTPCAFCSEKSRRCSEPTLTSAQTPSSNMEELPGTFRRWFLRWSQALPKLSSLLFLVCLFLVCSQRCAAQTLTVRIESISKLP